MNNNHILSALNLTINELQKQLSEVMTTKNALALQLNEEQETNNQLAQKVAELEALIDEQTQPKNKEVAE